MKRIASLLLTLTMIVGLALPTLAVDRVQWRTGIQPPSNWLNTMEKNKEIAIGQLLWDILGRNNSGGFFTNLTVTPGTGLYFNVGPASTNQLGSVYQIAPADLTAFGDGAGQIPADATTIFHQGLTNAQITYGPLTAPTGSFSVIDLIECQVNTVDTTQQTVNFVSATNVASSAQANRDRADKVLCQAKLGTPATSPVVPTVDSGWVAVAQVDIPANASQLTSGMITMFPQFNGFLPAGSAATFMDLSSNQTASGNKTFSGVTTLSNLMDFTNGAVTLRNLPQIAGDYQTNPGLLLNSASGSNGVQFMTNGVLNGAKVNTSGTFYTGSSYLSASGGYVNGSLGIPVNDAYQVGGLSALFGDGTQLNVRIPATTGHFYVQKSDASANAFAVDNSGNATALGNFLTGSSIYGATSAYVNGNIAGVNLPVGQCLTVDSGHNIIGAGGACGLASGTITNVVGTAPITASVSSGTATVGISSTPSFTGPVTIGTAATVGQLNLGTDDNLDVNRSGNTVTWQGLNGVVPVINAAGGFQSGSSFYFPAYMSVAGPMTGSSLALTGTALPTTGQSTIGYTGTDTQLDNFAATGAFKFFNNAGASWGDLWMGNLKSQNSGSFTTGSSTYGATSATVNGTATVGSLSDGAWLMFTGTSGAGGTTTWLAGASNGLQVNVPTGKAWNLTINGTSTNSFNAAGLSGIGNGVTLGALPVPAAATLSQSAGGALAATTYYVKLTYVNANGETIGSTEANLAVSANNVLTVNSPVVNANATGYNVYVSTTTATETKQNASAIALGTNWTEPTTGLISGAALPSYNTTTGYITEGASAAPGGIHLFTQTSNSATTLQLTDVTTGDAAPNKFVRVGASGDFLIGNSAYSTNILDLTDAGFLTLTGGASIGGNTNISGTLSTGTNSISGGSYVFPAGGYGIGIAGTGSGNINIFSNGYSNAATAVIDSTGAWKPGQSVYGPTSATISGNINVPAAGTATSGGSFASIGSMVFNNSFWNGSAAVANNWAHTMDNANNLQWAYNGTNELSLASSGALTAQGNILAAGHYIGSNSATSLVMFTSGTNINYLESGNAGFTGNEPLSITGFNAAQGSTLTLNFATLNFTGATASTCAGFDASKNLASSTSCLHSLSVTGPITNSGTALDPNLGCSTCVTSVGASGPISSSGGTSPSISCASCLTTAGGQTVSGGDTFNGTVTGYILSQVGPETGNWGIHLQDTTTTTTAPNKYIRANGSNGHLEFVNNAYTTVVANMDDSGNITATNFFNGSKVEWKHDISNIDHWDALDMLPEFFKYKYNKDHGDPNEWKIGYMADGPYAANEWLAGRNHDHFDAGALATLDGVAIKQLDLRLKVIEHRQGLGDGIVINGSTHDPRVDALITQVRLLWVLLSLLFLLCLVTLSAIGYLVKKYV